MERFITYTSGTTVGQYLPYGDDRVSRLRADLSGTRVRVKNLYTGFEEAIDMEQLFDRFLFVDLGGDFWFKMNDVALGHVVQVGGGDDDSLEVFLLTDLVGGP